MHGQPSLPADFGHLPYTDPTAPRGGGLRLARIGTFDSTNPYIVRGVPVWGVREYVHESLLARNLDEPFSLYGLLAERIVMPPDRSWVEFKLRAEARFSDGRPVEAADVAYSLETLRDHGRPNFAAYYDKVSAVEVPDRHTIRFRFSEAADRELPLILGLMPVIARHATSPETFEESTTAPPVGSGPYVMSALDPGKSVTYARNRDYWGDGLPINRGRYNFDRIDVVYYRDKSTLFEGFRKGLHDFHVEKDPARWATGYDFPAVRDGLVIREEVETALPSGMSAFVLNTRRPRLADIRVRRALLLLFNGEWINRNLYHGLYERTQSYYDRSELSSRGRPADAFEKALLDTLQVSLPASLKEGTYLLPPGDRSGRNRAARREALALFRQAGYAVRDGRLIDSASNAPFELEFVVPTRRDERLALVYAESLRGIGIGTSVRLVDSSQFENRKQNYDFDVIPYFWFASLSPGNEQQFYWGSQGRDTPGTRNYMGAENPVIDSLIAEMLRVRKREHFVSTVRALDRVLLSQVYVIPLFHQPRQWIARWRHLGRPQRDSLYGYVLDAWWHDPVGGGTGE